MGKHVRAIERRTVQRLRRPNRRRARMTGRLLFWSVLVLPGLAVAQPATKAAKSSSLSWTRLEGARSCIGTRELAQAVEQLLGRTVFVSAAQADLSVEGRVRFDAKGKQWQALIAMADSQGQPLGNRALNSSEPSCRSLDEPLALAIALMIDPDAINRPPPAPPPPPPPDPPEPRVVVERRPVYVPVPVDRPVAVPVDEKRRNPWRWDVRSGVALAVGAVPDVGFGVHAGGTMQPPWPVAFEGSATVILPRTTAVDAGSASFLVFYASGAICPLALRGDALTFWLCVESQVGAINGRAGDFATNEESTKFIFNSAARTRLSYRVIGALTVGGGLSVAVPWIRDRFVYRDAAGASQELFRMSPVVFVPEVHLGLRFP